MARGDVARTFGSESVLAPHALGTVGPLLGTLGNPGESFHQLGLRMKRRKTPCAFGKLFDDLGTGNRTRDSSWFQFVKKKKRENITTLTFTVLCTSPSLSLPFSNFVIANFCRCRSHWKSVALDIFFNPHWFAGMPNIWIRYKWAYRQSVVAAPLFYCC